MAQELIFPKQFNPHISDTLNQAIIQGMQRKAKNRPQTMAEWLKLFQSLPSSPLTQPICTSSSISYIPSSFDSEPEYLQPTVVPKEKEKPRQKKKRKEGAILKYVKQLPWFWLLILLEGFALLGFLGGTVEGVVVEAVEGAVEGAVGGAVVEAMLGAMLGAIQESKNKNQGFLITLGTAVGGFGIGWLLSLLW